MYVLRAQSLPNVVCGSKRENKEKRREVSVECAERNNEGYPSPSGKSAGRPNPVPDYVFYVEVFLDSGVSLCSSMLGFLRCF